MNGYPISFGPLFSKPLLDGIEAKKKETDAEAFKRAARKNGMPEEYIELLFEIARSTETDFYWGFGTHQICFNWVTLFRKNLEDALMKMNKSTSLIIPGPRFADRCILDVPLGAQGNTRKDIPFRNKITPYVMDFMSAHTARNLWKETLLGQDHTAFKIVLKDGSVWYFDLGMIQKIRNDDGDINSLNKGGGFVTPANHLPSGWSPTDKRGSSPYDTYK